MPAALMLAFRFHAPFRWLLMADIIMPTPELHYSSMAITTDARGCIIDADSYAAHYISLRMMISPIADGDDAFDTTPAFERY